ncbi:MAG: hypothetical protein FWH19_01280 [Treponema sp.]|nr:hypothetical protein [Treponema sp.]
MFNAELRQLLWEVIRSWQIIVVTIVLVIYISIIRNVGSSQRRSSSRSGSRSRPRLPLIRRKKKEEAAEEAPVADNTDELGLDDE